MVVKHVEAWAYDGKLYATEREAKAAEAMAELISLLDTCVFVEDPHEVAKFLTKHRNAVILALDGVIP